MAAADLTPQRTPVVGLLVALASAATFGSSGTFGQALLASGWSPGAIVTARITGAALVMLVPAALAMHGHWHLLRRNIGRIIAYGIFAVAGCQFAYFMAVDHLSVGVALLLEYTAPILVVGWLWATTGRRPSAARTRAPLRSTHPSRSHRLSVPRDSGSNCRRSRGRFSVFWDSSRDRWPPQYVLDSTMSWE